MESDASDSSDAEDSGVAIAALVHAEVLIEGYAHRGGPHRRERDRECLCSSDSWQAGCARQTAPMQR